MLAHEFLHVKSYKSARVGKLGEDVHLYRSGLSMTDRKDPNERLGEEKEYFGMLEEAIVAECTKRVLAELGRESPFREEAEAVKKIRGWVIGYYRRAGIAEEKVKAFGGELKYVADPQGMVGKVLAFSDDENKQQAYAAGMFGALYEQGDVESIERYKERKMLYALLDNLVEKSNGRFKNRDEVFDEFARANFSGNYLPLARTVEGILGKGSFRKLANEFAVDPHPTTGTR